METPHFSVERMSSSEGMPKKKLKEQSFKRGENIYFWSPVEGRIARFNADDDFATSTAAGIRWIRILILGYELRRGKNKSIAREQLS